ncbi:T9SS type A sorting domain-containing protein [Dyadobacter aurulentus]|uniref:T9SS type A sorting domain-containing protein n=1 Tax=Dyadobacter sp. UC 10 TaxID=2605428 RepID=UPI0011F14CB4|nr:T9SS type A sorting domain-containing protein [Dyadobacter sp. UC 10]KAA0991680.1 T9SS type A sorting domain-containing protein [Dyadobacter sp. UC 10]
MKKLYTVILLIVFSQTTNAQKIRFFYDEAGMRVKRGEENALPVTLVRFDVRKIEKEMQIEALLEWETSTEQNSDRFEIERSHDGKSWYLVGTVPATGGKNETSRYDAINAAPLEGQNYYRLKMIDRDDSFAYSQIRNIFLESTAVLYPNPVKNRLFIQGILCKSVQVLNTRGQILIAKASVNEEGIDISHLPDGTYIVKITGSGGETTTRTIAKR